MELNSFKELLIKKADGNEDLKALIQLISHDFLAEEVIESLEKMAASKGDKANSAMTSTAGSLTNADTRMLHDAISHHLSHAAAINKEHPPRMSPITHSIKATDHRNGGQQETRSFNTTKVDMHPTAAKHMEAAMHLADLAAKMSKHSFGKLNFDHVPTNAWEMNYTSDHTRMDKHGQLKYADDQQGLKRRLDNKRFPNHGYLLLDPHQSYKHKSKLRGHEGQYPFEEMKVNDRHVVIDPDHYVKRDESGKVPTTFTPHEFDSHPLMHKEAKDKTWERSEDGRSDNDRVAFANKLANWHESPEFNSWLDKQDAFETKDKDKYENHGKQKSKPMLEGVRQSQPKQDAPQPAAQPVAQQSQAQEVAKPQTITRKQAPSSTPVAADDARINKIRANIQSEPQGVKDAIENYLKGDPKATKWVNSLPANIVKKWGL